MGICASNTNPSSDVHIRPTVLGVSVIGRTCLAGPLIAVAAECPKILPGAHATPAEDVLRVTSYVVPAYDIDTMGIVHASCWAMVRCIQYALMDPLTNLRVQTIHCHGNTRLPLNLFSCAVVYSGVHTHATAYAEREGLKKWMMFVSQAEEEYPQWGFSEHMGRNTCAHRNRIRVSTAVTEYHRKTFPPLSRILKHSGDLQEGEPDQETERDEKEAGEQA